MEITKEQLEKFEIDTRRNALLIADFCEKAGMGICEAGAAAGWFSQCIKEAMRLKPDD